MIKLLFSTVQMAFLTPRYNPRSLKNIKPIILYKTQIRIVFFIMATFNNSIVPYMQKITFQQTTRQPFFFRSLILDKSITMFEYSPSFCTVRVFTYNDGCLTIASGPNHHTTIATIGNTERNAKCIIIKHTLHAQQ